MTKLEKVLLKKIHVEFVNCIQINSPFEFLYNDRHFRIGFIEQRIAGEQILRYTTHVIFTELEDVWYEYKNVLNYHAIYPSTITITLKDYNPEFYKSGYLRLSPIPNYDIERISDEIIAFTKKSIERFIDIVEVDKVINDPNDDLQESITRSQGGAFRKVLVARAANNPNAAQIEADVRAWCNKWYDYGLKENYPEMVNTKIVFDKIFGP